LASAASVASQRCFAEISLARSLVKPVFPLRLEAGASLALIDDVQWIDLSEGETAFARPFAGLRLAGLDPADSFAWDPTRSPYPGLKSFTGDDAAVFFGRDPEIARLVELLQPLGGDALPLLAYTLRELYQRAGADGTVTVAECQELGGVGALQSCADRLTDELRRRRWCWASSCSRSWAARLISSQQAVSDPDLASSRPVYESPSAVPLNAGEV
jgi:Novel STAND NTPase 1